MKNSKILYCSHFAIIASCAFFVSIKFSMPDAITTQSTVFFAALECFGIYCLFKMHSINKKEKQTTNNNNEVSQ